MNRSPARADARPAAPAHLELEATVICSRCGRAAAWGVLARMKVLEGAALESHLAVPPDGWFVDVRACSGCGRSLARKVRRRSWIGEASS
jgi:ribosomal protein L37E